MLPDASAAHRAIKSAWKFAALAALVAGCGADDGAGQPIPAAYVDPPEFQKQIESTNKKSVDAQKANVPRNAQGMPTP